MKVLHICEGRAGWLENRAWGLRREIRKMAEHLPIHSTLYTDPGKSFWVESESTGVFKKYGCGTGGLTWDRMVALSKSELVELGLVPSGQDLETPVAQVPTPCR